MVVVNQRYDTWFEIRVGRVLVGGGLEQALQSVVAAK